MGPHLLSDNQKADRARQALILLATLTTGEKQRWLNCWTGDESWIMWVNPGTGSWMTIDEELPQRVHQTIGARKSLLEIFFNPKEFSIVRICNYLYIRIYICQVLMLARNLRLALHPSNLRSAEAQHFVIIVPSRITPLL
jgi:hypothetical protein